MRKLIFKPVGKDVALQCKTSNNDSVTWYKNNITKLQDQTWKLLLRSVTQNDLGNYTCIACNHGGCINFTYELIILGKY